MKIASRNGGPMNPQLQELTIYRMIYSRKLLEWAEDIDIDSDLHLPENFENFMNQFRPQEV